MQIWFGSAVAATGAIAAAVTCPWSGNFHMPQMRPKKNNLFKRLLGRLILKWSRT